MENNFKPGDIVRLCCDGPNMVVIANDTIAFTNERFIPDKYICIWFDNGGALCEASFWEYTIEKVTEKKIGF